MAKIIDSTTIKLTPDRYGGMTIDSSTIPQTPDEFENKLIQIIAAQKEKKLLWIRLPIGKSNHIPFLTKYDFVFFDCTETSITLLRRRGLDVSVGESTRLGADYFGLAVSTEDFRAGTENIIS